MQFEAPEVILNIKDIRSIYEMNDNLETVIDYTLELMEDDIFIESCSEEKNKKV